MKYIEFFLLGLFFLLLIAISSTLRDVLIVFLSYILGGLTMFLSHIRTIDNLLTIQNKDKQK